MTGTSTYKKFIKTSVKVQFFGCFNFCQGTDFLMFYFHINFLFCQKMYVTESENVCSGSCQRMYEIEQSLGKTSGT